jgi:hypothetical protein
VIFETADPSLLPDGISSNNVLNMRLTFACEDLLLLVLVSYEFRRAIPPYILFYTFPCSLGLVTNTIEMLSHLR